MVSGGILALSWHAAGDIRGADTLQGHPEAGAFLDQSTQPLSERDPGVATSERRKRGLSFTILRSNEFFEFISAVVQQGTER